VRALCKRFGHEDEIEALLLKARSTSTNDEAAVTKIESERIEEQLKSIFKRRRVPTMTRPEPEDEDEQANAEINNHDVVVPQAHDPIVEGQSILEIRNSLQNVAVDMNLFDYTTAV
jgi:hypothetical protein